MKIKLLDEYKSLQPFESDELNELTIITGKNGSGKTQLLTLIGNRDTADISINTIRILLEPNLTQVQYEGLVKENIVTVNYDTWKSLIQKQYGIFRQLGPASKELIAYLRKNKITKPPKNQNLVTEDSKYLDLLSRAYSELNSVRVVTVTETNQTIQRRVLRTLLTSKYSSLFDFVEEICENSGKDQNDLTELDFYTSQIRESLIDGDNLFSSQVEVIFYNYAKRRDQNRKDFFYKKVENENNNSISDEEFTNKYPPPWKIINEILDRHCVDFYFKEIDKRFVQEISLDFHLVKKSSGKQILFSDLSSGEKVIISLILKLFTSEYYGSSLSFPDLLVLDEPDAPLHPEMSKLLIDVLQETFVIKYGIKVLFSTHSPSTIALCPESSIYELKNGANTSLKKISKDDALKLLTSFIPTLSIDYKNHRQIFVESPTDITYYQTLYDKHSQNRQLDYKLYFISNAMGKGNCEQVFDLVRKIRTSGNTTSYGIVDWDIKNKSETNIYVHGENERYSVENFILDPIYIVILLIQLNNAHDICGKTGISQDDNEYLIGSKSDTELQAICDVIFDEFEKKYPVFKAKVDLTEIKYYNGKTLKVPKWFLLEQGHSIVTKLKTVFPASNKYTNEGNLQEELATIMAKSYPFVPSTSVKLIEAIATHHK